MSAAVTRRAVGADQRVVRGCILERAGARRIIRLMEHDRIILRQRAAVALEGLERCGHDRLVRIGRGSGERQIRAASDCFSTDCSKDWRSIAGRRAGSVRVIGVTIGVVSTNAIVVSDIGRQTSVRVSAVAGGIGSNLREWPSGSGATFNLETNFRTGVVGPCEIDCVPEITATSRGSQGGRSWRRRGIAGRVRSGRITSRIVGINAVPILTVTGKTGVAVGLDVDADSLDMAIVRAVGGTINFETIFIAGVIRPSQVDLVVGNSRCSQSAWSVRFGVLGRRVINVGPWRGVVAILRTNTEPVFLARAQAIGQVVGIVRAERCNRRPRTRARGAAALKRLAGFNAGVIAPCQLDRIMVNRRRVQSTRSADFGDATTGRTGRGAAGPGVVNVGVVTGITGPKTFYRATVTATLVICFPIRIAITYATTVDRAHVLGSAAIVVRTGAMIATRDKSRIIAITVGRRQRLHRAEHARVQPDVGHAHIGT
jgi:hypothetical protein